MIRIIVSETDATEAANIGGDLTVTHGTFDVDLPEFEAWLTEPEKRKWSYVTRRFVGQNPGEWAKGYGRRVVLGCQ